MARLACRFRCFKAMALQWIKAMKWPEVLQGGSFSPTFMAPGVDAFGLHSHAVD